LRDAEPCHRCQARVLDLDGRSPLPTGAGPWWRDLPRGIRGAHRAVVALLHGRAFIGQLGLPVASNALGFALLVTGGALLLAPLFAACFAASWWLLDDWRAALAAGGPGRWLLTSWLLLGPPLLDAAVGTFQEPLRRTTETVMLGADAGAPALPALRRVRERAQVLAVALALWPVGLAVSLVPWIGLPLVVATGAAAAAVVWFEPPLAARGLRLRRRLELLWRNRWHALGLGLGLQLAAAVPFVNLLALAPAATVAATAAYLQFDKRR
jgi:hypothetical protein